MRASDTCLLVACARGYTEIVKCLLAGGVDVTHVNKSKMTCLVKCCFRNPSLEIASLLMDKGADVNAQSDSGRQAYTMYVRWKLRL